LRAIFHLDLDLDLDLHPQSLLSTRTFPFDRIFLFNQTLLYQKHSQYPNTRPSSISRFQRCLSKTTMAVVPRSTKTQTRNPRKKVSYRGISRVPQNLMDVGASSESTIIIATPQQGMYLKPIDISKLC
jgi:hypothetical protein